MAHTLPDAHQCTACGQPLPRFTTLEPPPLGPDEIRQLLRECVTVVKPGEILVLRCPEGARANEMDRLRRIATAQIGPDAGIRVLVVPHLDMAVVEAEGGMDEPCIA